MNQPVPDPRTTWEEEGAGGTEGCIAIHQYLWNKPGNGSQSRRKWNRVLKHPAELVHMWGWVSHSDRVRPRQSQRDRGHSPPTGCPVPGPYHSGAPGAAGVTGPWGGGAGTRLKAPASTFHSLLKGWREMGPSDLPKGEYPSPPGTDSTRGPQEGLILSLKHPDIAECPLCHADLVLWFRVLTVPELVPGYVTDPQDRGEATLPSAWRLGAALIPDNKLLEALQVMPTAPNTREAHGKLSGDPYMGHLNKQQLRYNPCGAKGGINHLRCRDDPTETLESSFTAFPLHKVSAGTVDNSETSVETV